MDVKDKWREIKCLGSTVVGPRGQVVIPVNARKELGIDAGTTLLVFQSFRGQGLVLLKADSVEQMLGMMSKRLADFEKMMEDYKPPKTTRGKEGVN